MVGSDLMLSLLLLDEMYVLSAKNNRVSIQLLGGDKIQDKLSRLDELTSASLPFLGVSSLGVSSELGSVLPSKIQSFFQLKHPFVILLISFASSVLDLKLLDLTGNLISDWEVYDCNISAKRLFLYSLWFDNLFLAYRKFVLSVKSYQHLPRLICLTTLCQVRLTLCRS